MFQILMLLQTIFSNAYINSLLSTYGYLGLFGMMTLEGASLPIPSEVIAPIAGYLAAKGVFNFYIAALAKPAGKLISPLRTGIILDTNTANPPFLLNQLSKASIFSLFMWKR